MFKNNVWKIHSDHNVAYTVVDEPLLPPQVHITADFSYIRWHGRGARPWYNYHYGLKELEERVPKILKASREWKNYGALSLLRLVIQLGHYLLTL